MRPINRERGRFERGDHRAEGRRRKGPLAVEELVVIDRDKEVREARAEDAEERAALCAMPIGGVPAGEVPHAADGIRAEGNGGERRGRAWVRLHAVAAASARALGFKNFVVAQPIAIWFDNS